MQSKEFENSFHFLRQKSVIFGTNLIEGKNIARMMLASGSVTEGRMVYERDNPMTCEEAQVVSFMYMKDDPDLTAQQREEFEAHLLTCSTCATEYEENKWLMGLLRQYWPISEDTKKLLQAAGYDAEAPEFSRASGEPYRPMTIEESWERLKLQWPGLAEACRRDERKRKLRRFVWRIGKIAAAACLLIAVSVGWFMHRGDSGQPKPDIAANAGSRAVFAELVTAEGRKPLALGQPMTAGTQPQEILLGGMHRVVMSRHTKATFSTEPRRTEGPHAGKVPYEIQLARGELYVEVVPGDPFTVKTANARLDITGTKFDVATDGEKTNLTLLKGSIRFSALDHPQQPVSVTTGHASSIAGRFAPTAPSPVDAVATTAWAQEAALRNVIASSQYRGVDADLQAISAMGQGLWRHSYSPDLDKLDYEKWRDERRQNQLALTALAAMPKDKAVSADWIEVLMISGDIWQFHYDPKLPSSQPRTKLQPQAITRLARHYGLDEKDILKALGLPDSALTDMAHVQDGALGRQYAAALRRWHDAILAAVDTQNNPKASDSLKSFSFNASLYLSETRIAAYLWVKHHPEEARQLLADRDYLAIMPTPPAMASNSAPDVDVWLKQLRKEATAAHNCIPAVLKWLTAPPGGCAYQATEQQRKSAALVAQLAS